MTAVPIFTQEKDSVLRPVSLTIHLHSGRTRDYRAAINAYTSCLDLDKRNSLALSNRALCHLRLNMFGEAIGDANLAFDLLKREKLEGKEPEERDQEMMKRARCLFRRAIAHTRLGMTGPALADLDAAQKICPDNEALKDDLEELRRSAVDSPYVKAKESGDKAFKSGDMQGACEWYAKAIDADGGCFQAYSNRAACYLSLEDFSSCVEDCTKALDLIDPSGARASKLCLRVLVRRGTAHCWANDFVRGREDLKRALLLDISNKQLKDDLSMLVTTTGAASSLQEFMEGKLPDAKSQAMAGLESAGVPIPGSSTNL